MPRFFLLVGSPPEKHWFGERKKERKKGRKKERKEGGSKENWGTSISTLVRIINQSIEAFSLQI